MRSSCLIALALAVATLAGCAGGPGPSIFGRNAPPPWARPVAAQPYAAQPMAAPAVIAEPVPDMAPVAYVPAGDGPYTLGSGDKLRVVVFGQEGVTNSYAVDIAGNISMPLIGPVQARGLTTQQISQSIAAKLRQGYIREPHVAVEVDTYRPFFILGEVTFPGQYPYVANMTIETAVAIAGGFTPRAKRSDVALARPYGGQTARATVPVFTPVRPGDTITVAERWF